MTENPPAVLSAAVSAGSTHREPLSVNDEATVVRTAYRRMLANLIRSEASRSRFRLILIALLTALFWVGMFALFLEAFQFLSSAIDDPTTRDETVRALYNVFFLSLFVMLIFSESVILFGSMFRSAETRFLLTTPMRDGRIFLAKFQEAVLFSSWGFGVLGSPMLVAYGVATAAPWYYFVLMVPAMLLFVLIPCGIGAVATLVVCRFLPRPGRVLLVVALGGLVVGCAALVWWQFDRPRSAFMTSAWFQAMLGRMQFAEQRLLPSWWLSTGLLEAAQREWSEAVLFVTLLCSNALLVRQIAVGVARRTYRTAFHRLAARSGPAQRVGETWFDRMMLRYAAPLPYRMRLLIVKDLRLFRRDPVQWLQFTIFFGLLGLYFINIRRLSYDLSQATWVNMVSFLNLAVVGLILSTFTSRFVFPMISLEGRRFWVLGRLPIERDMVLWSKFLFAGLGSLVPCGLLVMVSDLMLGVPAVVLSLHLATCCLLCLGLAGISVGLGAMMPNLREDSPTKIAAGPGGTMNLVVSSLYIAAIVLLTAVPFHFYMAAVSDQRLPFEVDLDRLRVWVMAGAAASLALGVAATAIPMWLGLRAFRRLEA